MQNFLKTLGPGLLYAGAAIGVSHLVQSTRAGSDFGYGLVWAVIIANLLKYPFFEMGPRYATATGKTLLDGYKNLGSWALIIYLIMTFGTMFTIQAAVTVVTAGLAEELTGIVLPPWAWSAILLAACLLILGVGRFSFLDKTMKVVIVVLSLTTIAAFIAAFGAEVQVDEAKMAHFSWSDHGHVVFLIALMGWMPAPIDISIWSSVWNKAKQEETGYRPTMKEALLDFNIGYWGTLVLALCFLGLGAMVIYGTDVQLAAAGGAFSRQLIGIYTSSLGKWAYWLIAIAAFTTMFSTTITCLDAFPRVLRKSGALLVPPLARKEKKLDQPMYWIWILITALGAVMVLAFFISSMKVMVDIATILSFLTAPVLAGLNYLVMYGKDVAPADKPGTFLKVLAWLGMAFLVGFSGYYLVVL
ncbi:MAG: Nramp family divalent metal transporter [Bacteroidia bacterium]|nr:Nramp family divalent metal transporter [Bacteroidia bacterium]